MQALLALTRANIRSYARDPAAVCWTHPFPLVFIALFGPVSQGDGAPRRTVGRAGAARDRPGGRAGRRVEFDDAGAESGEQHRAERPGHHRGDVQDAKDGKSGLGHQVIW